jgi:hypothetical protein
MSILIDLIASLEKQLSEADSEAKAKQGEFFKWHKESEKEVFSVFENPTSTEADKENARHKFHIEDMQKRRETLQPAFEKRDKIQEELSEKAEWLRKGYEMIDPTASSQAVFQEPTVRPPLQPPEEPTVRPPQEPTVRPPQEPLDQQATDKEAKLQRDKEREMEMRKRAEGDLSRTSPSGKSGDDGKSGSPGKSYMLSGSNLKGKKGEIGEKGKDVKKKK